MDNLRIYTFWSDACDRVYDCMLIIADDPSNAQAIADEQSDGPWYLRDRNGETIINGYVFNTTR